VNLAAAPPLLFGLVLGLALLVPAVAAEEQRAILRLVVNDVPGGDLIVFLRADDLLVKVADLEKAGLTGFTGRRETIAGEAYVSLVSLTPDVAYQLDEKAAAVRLTAQPALLPTRVLEFGTGRPQGIVYRHDASAFLNYGATTVNFDRFAVFAEGGVSARGALLYSSASRNEDGTFVRGLSSLTYDDRPRLMRWVAGDLLVPADPLGSSLLMGGLGVSTTYGIDPYFVTFPRLELVDAVTTPSTAEVYVNGQLVRRERLAPGTVQLRDLPLPSGSGIASVLIRDAFGREREISSPYYLSTRLLAKGLQDFTYNVGLGRDNLGTESWDYNRFGFLGRHRLGVTNDVTAGGRLEAGTDLVSGGPSVTLGFPFGEMEVSAAASYRDGKSGAAVAAAYQYLSRQFNFGAAVRAASDRYATLALRPAADRPRAELTAFIGAPLGARASATVQYVRSDLRDQGWSDRTTLLSSIRVTDRANVFFSVGRSTQERFEPAWDVFVGLSVALGEQATASVSYQRQSGKDVGSAEVQQSLPLGPGFGYRVRGDIAEGAARGLAVLQYQGPYGRYEASYERIDSEDRVTASIAGGLIAAGGSVFATRPVNQSFAVIQVPGVEGVRGYLNNQEIGRTNARGDLPVPDLLPYYGNRLGIAQRDIPLDYAVGATEQVVASPFRGGAVVRFAVQQVRAVMGSVLLVRGEETFAPAYGQIVVTVDGQETGSPIGRDGEFYFENVAPGQYPAVVEHETGRCAFTLEVPAGAGPIVELGTVRCTLGR
jgi:outer membrane usher protein